MSTTEIYLISVFCGTILFAIICFIIEKRKSKSFDYYDTHFESRWFMKEAKEMIDKIDKLP
jgi:hypothetical protein